jgi:curved DNA-binding protein CbpA
VSDEKPKPGSGASAPAPGGPPKLERVPAGYRPPPSVRKADAPQPAPPPAPKAAPPVAPRAAAPPAPRAAPPPAAAPGSSYGLAAREVGADAAIAAAIAHEGELASEGPLRLFALAAATQATGRLTLAPEGEASAALSFRRGTVEHADSSDPEDDLGRFLVRKGALTEAQRARGEAARAGSGGDLAAALIGQGLVIPADVAGLLQEHRAGIVSRALAVTAGRWTWDPAAPSPPGAFPLGAPFAMLCAAVRTFDAAGVITRLGDREHRAASRVGGRMRLEELRLTPQEARAAGIFDGVRSPAELAGASPAEALVILRVALLLGEVELLAFGASTRGARAPAAGSAGAAPAAATPGAPAPPRPAAPRPAAGAPRATPSAGSAKPGRAAPAPGATPVPPAAPRAASAPTPAPLPRPAPVALEKEALEALLAKLAEADHFEALGVPRTAPAAQIKAAYFQLAKVYHPDAVPGDASGEVRKLCAELFARLGDAWSVLGQDASREAYLEAVKTGGTKSVDVANIFRAESLFEEGTLLVKARRYDEAIRKFGEALALNAEEAEFGIWKAFCEFLVAADKRAKHPGSAKAIEAGLKKNPRCAQGYLFLGQMAKVVGDLGLAERHLRRGLDVAPDHLELQRELKYLRK